MCYGTDRLDGRTGWMDGPAGWTERLDGRTGWMDGTTESSACIRAHKISHCTDVLHYLAQNCAVLQYLAHTCVVGRVHFTFNCINSYRTVPAHAIKVYWVVDV
jgi:hypothetical protein